MNNRVMATLILMQRTSKMEIIPNRALVKGEVASNKLPHVTFIRTVIGISYQEIIFPLWEEGVGKVLWIMGTIEQSEIDDRPNPIFHSNFRHVIPTNLNWVEESRRGCMDLFCKYHKIDPYNIPVIPLDNLL